MKYHYAGKYTSNTKLPEREHPEGYVKFREPDDMTQLAKIATAISIAILVICWAASFLITGVFACNVIGALLSLVTMVPHEFLHAIWFREDVYMYQNLKQGMLFVIGTEDMSKARFVAMSLCPNVIFGLIPYLVFLVNPAQTMLGTLGILALSMGAGDFMNVFNALTQVPRGGKVYLSGMNSFWYMP